MKIRSKAKHILRDSICDTGRTWDETNNLVYVVATCFGLTGCHLEATCKKQAQDYHKRLFVVQHVDCYDALSNTAHELCRIFSFLYKNFSELKYF